MKKTILSLLTAFIAITGYAQVSDSFQGIMPVTDHNMMKTLNGKWNLKIVEGISNDATVPAQDHTWSTIAVPGC